MLVELSSSGRSAAATISQALADVEQRALAKLHTTAVEGFYDVLQALTAAAS